MHSGCRSTISSVETAEIRVSGFVWDAINLAKIAGHGLSIQDVEAVRHNAPKYFKNLPGRSANYAMLGRIRTEGSYLQLLCRRMNQASRTSSQHSGWTGGEHSAFYGRF